MEKEAFIAQLAEFFVVNAGRMSIGLATNDPMATEWANLRNTTPLQGYPTIEESIQILTEFLK